MPNARQLGLARLYKFRSVDDRSRAHTLKIITHNQLKFSSPSEFNDPFEARPTVQLAASKKDVEQFITKLAKNQRLGNSPAEKLQIRHQLARLIKANPEAAFKQTLHNIIADYGVLSLSAESLHPLMWSHYADSHRGICIEFDATQHFFQFAHRVEYADDYPVVDPMKHDPRKINELAILTKATFWKYEQEWRVIFPTDTEQEKAEALAEVTDPVGRELIKIHHGPGIYDFPNNAMTGVILGARISDTRAREVSDLVRTHHPNAHVDQAMLHNSAYRLERGPR